MRLRTSIPLLFFFARPSFPSATETETEIGPFLPPTSPNNAKLLLQARQNHCASSGTSCSGLGAPSLCCPKSSRCAIDESGQVACCPSGAACTGTIGPGAIVTPTGAASITGVTAVPNAYYPFPIIPVTYANADICSASYSQCQAQLTSCTSVLGGAGSNNYPLTVAGGGGVGITVPAATVVPVGPASAAQICSSLRAQACWNLQLTNCASFSPGTATATATGIGGFQAGSGGTARVGKGTSIWKGTGLVVGLAWWQWVVG